MDLRSTVNALHLRTCADSAEALCQLINYLASNGDLAPQFDGNNVDDGFPASPLPGSRTSSGSAGGAGGSGEAALISTADSPAKANSNAPLVTAAQQQRVATLMEDAMLESVQLQQQHRSHGSRGATGSSGTELTDDFGGVLSLSNSSGHSSEAEDDDDDHEVFFFPDEAAQQRQRLAERAAAANAAQPKVRCQSISLPTTTTAYCDLVNNRAAVGCSSNNSGSSSAATMKSFESDTMTTVSTAAGGDRASINTMARDLVNFETNQMPGATERLAAVAIADHPQVANDLGSVNVAMPPPTTTTAKTTTGGGGRSHRRTSTGAASSTTAAVGANLAGGDTDDEFIIIGEEERPRCGFETVPVANPTAPICIVDNHFSVPAGQADLLQAPADFPMAVTRYTLCELTLTLHLFGGQDFETTPANG